MPFKQSHPIAAFREQPFSLRTASGLPVTGQAFATTDLQFVKPGGVAWANCGNQGAVVEIGGGDYKYIWLASELDTPGTGLMFKVNKAGAMQVEYADVIERAFFATAITGTLGASAFTTDRTEAVDNYWKYALVTAISGGLLGQVKKIDGYTGANKLISLAAGQAFTAAPVNGDLFELINR